MAILLDENASRLALSDAIANTPATVILYTVHERHTQLFPGTYYPRNITNRLVAVRRWPPRAARNARFSYQFSPRHFRELGVPAATAAAVYVVPWGASRRHPDACFWSSCSLSSGKAKERRVPTLSRHLAHHYHSSNSHSFGFASISSYLSSSLLLCYPNRGPRMPAAAR